MGKISTEIKVGAVIIVAIALLVYGYGFLSGKNLFSTQSDFYAVYSNIDGLQRDNPVQLNGFTVGKVNDIFIDPKNPESLVVNFVISEPSVKIPKGTIAQIVNLDLLGSKAISLQLGNSQTMHAFGDTLTSANQQSLSEAVNQEILPLKIKAESLISEMDSAIKIVQAILNEDARKDLGTAFSDIGSAISTLKGVALKVDVMMTDNKARLDKVMINAQDVTDNLKQSGQNITKIVTNVTSITDSLKSLDLAGTLRNADKALTDLSMVIEKVNNGEGTLGKLMNDESVYENLEQSMLELDKLLEDVRVNPERYVHVSVFGKKEKEKNKPQKKARPEDNTEK